MNRAQLEHLIRAAASIAGDDEIVVLGSQAILGQFPNAPTELLVSMEADVYPRNYPEHSDLIDGSIGELSPFHKTFGYYAQGVEAGVAVLPRDWETRLVPVKGPRTAGATGLCLEVHDLAISKLIAGREKDVAFLSTLVHHHMVSREALLARLAETPLETTLCAAVRARIDRIVPS